jgi:putative intracellular protease/amidase
MNRILLIAVLILLAVTAQAAEPKPYTRNVAIVIYQNAEPLDWAGPFEVYNDAAGIGSSGDTPAFNVYLVSKTTDPINAQGLRALPQYSIVNAPKPDIVLFPGGASTAITDDPEFFAWAAKASSEAEIAQSVCTGAFVLGKAGLLDNLEVTTWYGAIESLQQRYPKATVRHGHRFVDNGHVVTTAGVSAGIDGSLHVVARLLGRRVADQVASYMEYHWTPESHHASTYAYLNPSLDARGRGLQAADMKADEKDYAGAAATYRAALRETPKDRSLWNNLAAILDASNDHLGSAEAFAKVAALSTGDSTARAHLAAARAYAAAERGDDAVSSVRKAIAAGWKDREALATDPVLGKYAGAF